MQMDLKSKQIFRVWNAAGFGWKQRGNINRKKRNEIMNLLRKINRHIKLIGKKIQREHWESKASFPELRTVACCLDLLTKSFPQGAAAEHRHQQGRYRSLSLNIRGNGVKGDSLLAQVPIKSTV